MHSDRTYTVVETASLVQLHAEWHALCERYLPVVPADSIWRYHRERVPGDPEQGWKLHLSATVLNAAIVLARVAPLLAERGVQFKAPATLQELRRLNAGLRHGYSQVGKCITVYPATPEEAVFWAGELHRLTFGVDAPAVPFERRYQPDSNVYYRYGAFRRLTITDADGMTLPALRDRQGALVPDLRVSAAAHPQWVQDPFPQRGPSESLAVATPLQTTFRVFRALAQRGKGGVYQALDCSVQPPRVCLLKEGRRHGEVSWDGRDGAWRVRQEEHVLAQLRAAGIAVPRIYASFELEGNYYLATEFVAGESLAVLLNRRRRRLPLLRALRYGAEIASLLARIHAAGWVWRDCKPANLLVTRQGHLRPLDFEGACPIAQPDVLPWGTPAFAPPLAFAADEARASVPDDLYALGVVLYLLLAGTLPATEAPRSLASLRRGIPTTVHNLIMDLLTAAPKQRPAAQMVAHELQTRAMITPVAGEASSVATAP